MGPPLKQRKMAQAAPGGTYGTELNGAAAKSSGKCGRLRVGGRGSVGFTGPPLKAAENRWT